MDEKIGYFDAFGCFLIVIITIMILSFRGFSLHHYLENG